MVAEFLRLDAEFLGRRCSSLVIVRYCAPSISSSLIGSWRSALAVAARPRRICAAAASKRATARDPVKRGTGSSTSASVGHLRRASRSKRRGAARPARAHALFRAPSARGRGRTVRARILRSAGYALNPPGNCYEGARAGAQQATSMWRAWWRRIDIARSTTINARHASKGSWAR